MYTPDYAKMQDMSGIHDFINTYDFGVMISASLEASHLPFLLRRDEGGLGTLYAHMAKANPHWQSLDAAEVLIVFSGPHGYVSPTWYDTFPAVPTWNYAAVHVKGVVTLLSPAETASSMDATIGHYEPALLDQNPVMTEDYKRRLLPAIVAFKVTLLHLEGKAKLSQNRSLDDRQSAIRHLSASGDGASIALAALMQASLPTEGNDG